MQRVTIQAVKGGVQVVTGGQTSTTIVEGSFPGCTVSVFDTGTVNLSTIYGDNLHPPTLKANPFVADQNGFGFFYAANGSRVDVQLSGTGIVTPFVVAGDILLDDPSLLTIVAPQTVAFNANPTFDLSVASWFIMTLTGNVTGPAFTNPVSGQLLILSLIQNAAGGHTFAFPVAFLDPPAIALGSNARTELIFKYDGANWTMVAATGDSLQVPTTAVISGTLVVNGVATLASLSVTGNATVGGTLGVTGAVTLSSTINKITLTQPATGATITIADGKVLTVSKTLTLTGTDGTTQTFPATSATIARTDAAQTFSGDQTIGQTIIDGTNGKIKTYHNVATVSEGVPYEVAKIDLAAQNNNIGATLLYAVPAAGAGFYRITAYAVITTAAGVSSTLPNVNIIWTDNDTNVAIAAVAVSAQSAANTVGTNSVTAAAGAGLLGSDSTVINARASTNINYTTTNYASNAANAMQYALHIRVEYLGS